jgi:AraC family transcriptional regulator of adaptative response/methylated-DNA-[protein]-cysteine methyltransferase
MNSRAHAIAASNVTAIDPRLQRARRLLDIGDHSLTELAAAVGISRAHLQRRFRACFGVSPAEYRAQRRLESLRRALKQGDDVSGALYDAGYGSPSRVYEQGAAKLGMTLARYRAGGAGEAIRWNIVDTALGKALVATTQRGICMVEIGDDARKLETKLRGEFPQAQLQRVNAGSDEFLAPRLRAVADVLAGKRGQVPLDLIGTAFQKRVWEELMKIPRGQTRSYAQIADSVGAPRSARSRRRLRAQPRRHSGALPPRDPRRRIVRRLPLGAAAETAVAAPRACGVNEHGRRHLRRRGGAVGRFRPCLMVSNTSRVS